MTGQVISGPPLGGLPQPALTDGGERQLPAGSAEHRQVPHVLSALGPGVTEPAADVTAQRAEDGSFLPPHRTGKLPGGKDRDGTRPAQFFGRRPQHMQPGGEPGASALLQAIQDLDSHQLRQPAQADLAARRDRGSRDAPAFLAETLAGLQPGHAQPVLMRLAVAGAAGAVPQAGRHLARACRRQRDGLRQRQELPRRQTPGHALLAPVLTAQHPAGRGLPAPAPGHRAPGDVAAPGAAPAGGVVVQQRMPGRRGDHPCRRVPADPGKESRGQPGGKPGGGSFGHRAGQSGSAGRSASRCGAHGRGHRGTAVPARGLSTLSTASRSRAGSGCTYTCDDAAETWPSRSAITSIPPPASATFEPKACLS